MKKIPARTLNMILGGVIFLGIIGMVVLAVFWFQEKGDQDDLKAEIQQKELQLKVLQQSADDDGDLNTRLEEAQAKLEAAKALIPPRLDSNDVMEKIFEYADENHVTIPGGLNIPPEQKQEIEGNSYTVVQFNLTITGTFQNILNFIDTLENNPEIQTFTVSNVSLSGEGASWNASFNVAVFSSGSDEEKETTPSTD